MLSMREILCIFLLLITLAACEDTNREAQMRHAMMEADAQNKAYIDFTTDSVMKQVAEYYDHNGNSNDRMRAHYLLGCTYRDMGDAPAELECLQKAVESADTEAQDCDFYVLTAIYGQIADIYDSQYLPDEEIKILKQVEK